MPHPPPAHAPTFATAAVPWRLWGIGALASLLLLAFLAVVQQAVRQGVARRQAAAELGQATWRCKALRGHAAQASCLSSLCEARAADGTAPAAPPVVTAAAAVR